MSFKDNKALFQSIKEAAKNNGIQKNSVRPYILALYAPLSNTNSTISFDFELAEDTDKAKSVSVRLSKSSVVVGTGEIALGVHRVKTENAKTLTGNSPLVFRPDTTYFGEAQAKHISMLYNSKLMLKTDTTIRLENFKTNIFEGAPNTSAAYKVIPFVDMGSAMLLVGGRDNKASVNLPSGDYSGIAGEEGYTTFAVLLLKGFEIVSGANNSAFVGYLDSLTQ